MAPNCFIRAVVTFFLCKLCDGRILESSLSSTSETSDVIINDLTFTVFRIIGLYTCTGC